MLDEAISAIKNLVRGELEPPKADGPGDVGPTIDAKQSPDLIQPGLPAMSADEVAEWWERVEAAEERIKQREAGWDTLLTEYLPKVSSSGTAEDVKIQQHFRNVHTKLGQLFYQTPELVLSSREPSMLGMAIPNPMPGPPDPETGMPTARPPMTMADIVKVKKAVLTQLIGRDGIKSNRLIDELLFDVLGWAGIGCSKVGYHCYYKQVQPPAPVNPMGITQLGLSQPKPVPVMVHEEWFARRFSPKKLLVNSDLRSTRFDEDATFMGMRFFMSPRMGKKVFKLSDSEVQWATEDNRIYQYPEDSVGSKTKLISGVELWVRASHYTDEVHPQVLYQLILIDGIKDRPMVWRMSPHQTIGPDGRLTKNSVIGFPIRVLTIRDLADSPFPPSDSAFTNAEIKQQTTLRRQEIRRRDKSIGQYVYDTGVVDNDALANLKNPDKGPIGLPSGSLADGVETVITTTPPLQGTMDDRNLSADLKQDVTETLGISTNGGGAFDSKVRSATESANVQANMLGRSGKELGRVTDHWLDIVRMIDQLHQRYADEEDYVEIAGPDGAKIMQMWTPMMIQGRYLYSIAPDSSLTPDSGSEFAQIVQFWNLAAPSPLANQAYILRKMAEKVRLDPDQAVIDPAMMPKPPEEPRGKWSMALNGMDLNNPLVIKMLIDEGIIKKEDAKLNLPQQPEPLTEAADKAPALSQHTTTNSGGMENAPDSGNFREQQARD